MKIFILFILSLLLFFPKKSIPSSLPDSSVVIYKWKVSKFNDIFYYNIDTSLNYFQIHKESTSFNSCNPSLGNSGLPCIELNLTNNLYNNNIPSLNYLSNYLNTDLNTYYYNTKRHYSSLKYYSGSNKESILSLIHCQNINPSFNVGFNYNLIYSIGEFQRQATRDNNFKVFSSYSSLRYSFNFNYNFNNLKFLENGGISSDSAYEYSNQKTKYLDPNLTNASSKVKLTDINLHQEYKLGKIIKEIKVDTISKDSIVKKEIKLIKSNISFLHNINFSNSYRIYEDKNPKSGFYNKYYTDSLINDTLEQIIINSTPYFISDSITYDSINSKAISNRIGIKVNSNNFLKTSIVGYYKNILMKNYFYNTDTSFYSNYIGFFLSKKIKNKILILNTEYGINGYNKSDLKISSENLFPIKNSSSGIIINFSFSRISPEYFTNNYFSNHFKWDSTFLKKDDTRYEISYYNNKYHLYIGIRGLILDNFIFYDEIGFPRQSLSTFNIYSINISKDFAYKSFNYRITGTYQLNENKNILKAPDYIIKKSIFFTFNLYKRNLKINTGIDALYYPSYKGYSYMPATGIFYIQNVKDMGNYPFVDLYISMSLKRALFFIKFENIMSDVMDRKYYNYYNYPVNSRFLKIGLSWNFYD